VTTQTWDPQAYQQNGAFVHGLAGGVLEWLDAKPGEYILDLGCGDGQLSRRIVDAGASVLGVDTSAEMIAAARERWVEAEHASAEALPFSDGVFDAVFSNAALHWVDDHRAFLRGVAAVLKADGRLVVSCGGKGNAQDVFVALRPEMRLKRWRGFFRRIPKPYFFYSPADYEKWLPLFGFKTISVRLVPKDAVYAGRDKFVAWLRTTWLPYVQRVPENLREEFIAAVADRYLAKHPPDAEGKVHVRMVRLEIEAVKD